MSVASSVYYFVRCDSCRIRADYDGEPEAWSTPDRAVAQLPAFWTTDGRRHHCPDCLPLAEEVPD